MRRCLGLFVTLTRRSFLDADLVDFELRLRRKQFYWKPQPGKFPGRNGNLRMIPLLAAATLMSLKENDWKWDI